MPKITYRQGLEPTCVTSGLASALHFLGHTAEAEQLAELGRQFMAGPTPSKILPFTATWLQKEKKLSSKWHLKKLHGQHNVWTLNTTHQPALIVMRESDGSQWHAVTIVNNMIFDSSQEKACAFNPENLDKLCAVGSSRPNVYNGIEKGYHLVLSRGPKTHRNPENIANEDNSSL